MASAEVLSNSAVSSRKQALEAGKRRLEEFRKKKAAKAAASGQTLGADSAIHEKQASENGPVELSNSAGADAGRRIDPVAETSGFLDCNDKSYGLAHASVPESVALTQVDLQSHNVRPHVFLQMQPKQEGDDPISLGLKRQTSSTFQQVKENGVGGFGTDTKEEMYDVAISSAGCSAPRDDSSTSFHSTFYGGEESFSAKDNSSESLPSITSSRNGLAAKVSPKEPATNLSHNESGYVDFMHCTADRPAYAAEPFSQNSTLFLKDHLTSISGERKLDAPGENLSSFCRHQATEPPSAGFDISATRNGPLYSSVADTFPRRFHPSFLDSLNIGRDLPVSGRQEVYTSSSKFSSSLGASSAMQEPSTACAPEEPRPTPASTNATSGFFGSSFTGQKLFENNLESDLQRQRPDEDFAALEQHIEDLTQEKFSLQRALEASKALSESLAAENSSLTESYNHQAIIVNQLKVEIERLQGEIKAQLVELEATKAGYVNAQLECNAADERAKLLASEVIGLEEKVLRLRSNELKMERELENASREIASYKKRLASLDKERQDLLQTIDALQEEKRLFQSKFRRASSSGVTVDINKGHARRDASTSTNDLGSDAPGIDGDNSEVTSSSVDAHEDANVLLLLHNRHAGPDDFAMIIPPDQAEVIQNINSLISEIKAEKEELIQALVTEVSTSTRLKDLNKELSHKLEVQTQRLELLTAQSMASENTTARELTGFRCIRESVAYADEGDEVVERVLGWIMKLFPGGPSRRRPSRL